MMHWKQKGSSYGASAPTSRTCHFLVTLQVGCSFTCMFCPLFYQEELAANIAASTQVSSKGSVLLRG